MQQNQHRSKLKICNGFAYFGYFFRYVKVKGVRSEYGKYESQLVDMKIREFLQNSLIFTDNLNLCNIFLEKTFLYVLHYNLLITPHTQILSTLRLFRNGLYYFFFLKKNKTILTGFFSVLLFLTALFYAS